ncbi:MAG: helix-turn-helix domain-containing protein [Verrucomicrobia bacterium]|jgi:HTH-type transcriptional regulator/antitoxin HigA|nr:helix-turn-helix domain-containing protein [Verrucomicrobiota bacterium]
MTILINRHTPLPATYEGLVAAFMPRPIHDKVGHDNTLAVIDAMAGRELNADQEEYLDLLSTLFEAYEDEILKDELASLPRGVAMLQYLCQENGISGVELGRILDVGRAQASLLLKGERNLTVPHLQRLSEHFKVSSELFIQKRQ